MIGLGYTHLKLSRAERFKTPELELCAAAMGNAKNEAVLHLAITRTAGDI
jgi:hypothetical protein